MHSGWGGRERMKLKFFIKTVGRSGDWRMLDNGPMFTMD